MPYNVNTKRAAMFFFSSASHLFFDSFNMVCFHRRAVHRRPSPIVQSERMFHVLTTIRWTLIVDSSIIPISRSSFSSWALPLRENLETNQRRRYFLINFYNNKMFNYYYHWGKRRILRPEFLSFLLHSIHILHRFQWTFKWLMPSSVWISPDDDPLSIFVLLREIV